MSPANRSELVKVSEKEVAAVRATLNLGDEDSIRRDVDMVLEWYRKQQHLPREPLDRDFAERMLVNRKGSVEQAKQRIDLICTLRTIIPEMASPRDILHPAIKRQLHSVVYAPMPKLNHDLTRIQIYKVTTEPTESYNLEDTMKYIFMGFEYRLKNDYSLGDRFIFDLEHLSVGHVTKTNPITLKKAEVMMQGYGYRVFGIHYVNAPTIVALVLNIFKQGLSAKLNARLKVHPTLDDLHQHISKEILPKEYGGEEEPLDTVAERWKGELSKEENRQYLIQQESLKSDEALRLDPTPSDEMLGIPGSFKRIDVD